MSEWIIGILQQTGYVGIFGLMVLENLFPPIPSELIMPFAGYVAAQGKLSPWLVALAGTLGSVVGALPWYWAGRRFGENHLRKLAATHGRWMTMTPDDVTEAGDAFRKHGAAAVFFGRVMPGIRTLISVPAGVMKMAFWPFLAFTTAGSVLWVGLLTAAGYVLGSQQELVAEWLDPVSKVILGGMLLVYVYRVATFGSRTAK